MLMPALAICVLAASARADANCDACIDGWCHTRKTILSGFPVTDQLAIDRSQNVLYVQLDGNLNTAVFLDNHEVRLINTEATTGMVVDQDLKLLYMGTKSSGLVYKYDLNNNMTVLLEANGADDIDKSITTTTKMFFGWNTLFSIIEQNNMSHVYYVSDRGSSIEYTSFHVTDLPITSLVSLNNYLKLVISNNTLYKYDRLWSGTEILNKSNNMVLSVDKDEENAYISDATERVIYKFNRDAEKLSVYAAYKTGAVKDFVFGGDNRIVFRDADDSIVQWVSHDVAHKCSVEPPSERFFIRPLETECTSNNFRL